MSTPLPPVKSKNSLAVSCHGVTKTYGRGQAAVQALRGVDLEVRTGELLMLVGPSGCGKTTLISVIAGVLGRDGGECTVFDHDYQQMRELDTTRFRGRNIGFVFQAFNLIPTLTAAENVAVPLIINGGNRHDSVESANAVLEKVGFDRRMISSFPQDLSGGQQQRVAIARALVHNPRLIVCDEPTSALDGETGHLVMDLMRRLALGKDRALVVVTHDARIFEFADRIARMEDGSITGIEIPPPPAAAPMDRSPALTFKE
jgi:putative ABC transport system ATP-binding protein